MTHEDRNKILRLVELTQDREERLVNAALAIIGELVGLCQTQLPPELKAQIENFVNETIGVQK